MTHSQAGTIPSPPDQNLRVALVVWQDSIQYADGAVWKPIDWVRQIAKTMAVVEHRSVGFVLADNDEYILFTHSIRPDGATAAAMSIPKRQITEIRYASQGDFA